MGRDSGIRSRSFSWFSLIFKVYPLIAHYLSSFTLPCLHLDLDHQSITAMSLPRPVCSELCADKLISKPARRASTLPLPPTPTGAFPLQFEPRVINNRTALVGQAKFPCVCASAPSLRSRDDEDRRDRIHPLQDILHRRTLIILMGLWTGIRRPCLHVVLTGSSSFASGSARDIGIATETCQMQPDVFGLGMFLPATC